METIEIFEEPVSSLGQIDTFNKNKSEKVNIRDATLTNSKIGIIVQKIVILALLKKKNRNLLVDPKKRTFTKNKSKK